MRKLGILGLIALAVGLSWPAGGGNAAAEGQSRLESIKAWLYDKPKGSWDVMHQDGRDIQIWLRFVEKEIDRTPHRNFRIYWDRHVLSTVFYRLPDGTTRQSGLICFDLIEYRDLSYKDARQATQWNLVDDDGDGRVDRWHRDFRVHTECSGIVYPHYPEGLINTQWYRPSRDKAQDAWEKEVGFWAAQIDARR